MFGSFFNLNCYQSMKKYIHFFICFLLLLVSPLLLKAGKPPIYKWTANHFFEQKVFIENKGQYTIPNKAVSNDILFGAQQGGLSYYFTTTGIWIERYVPVKNNLASDNNAGQAKYKPIQYSYINVYHKIDFIGANSLPDISGNSEVNQYYNFKINGSVNVKAHAYNKITYTNLYPGIDMEFYFPKNKSGFEYDFIVHPGADISLIKIQYPFSKGVMLTVDGNMHIVSTFGEFIDHAPVASLQSNAQPVNCSFTLQNRTVQFKVANYNKNESLLIDPWTATPVFPGSVSDRAYDIDYDDAGNCYVYGGSGQYSEFPLYMIKYDSTGTLLWQTQIKDYYSQDWGTELYGDFVVIKNTQSVFVNQGVNIFSGAKVLKLDQAGAQVDSSTGDIAMNALWRIAYSAKYNELVGVGGNYPNYPSPTAMYIDTNLITETVVYVNNPPNPYEYMWGVTLDNSGNCYMAISGRSTTDTTGDDLFKVPMPALSPNTWEVNDGYELTGIGDPQYIAHNNGNGINGITATGSDVYTCDSYTLKKWSGVNGTLVKSVAVTPITAQYIYWSGLVSDSCGNIFVGCHDTIKHYDTSLNLLNYFIAPDTVYGLALGNHHLYACGADFVTAYKLTGHLINTINNTDSDTTLHYKICLGNYIGLKAGGANTYSWSPSYGLNATTGDSVTAAPSLTTTYTVICTNSLNCPTSGNDTFHVVVTVDTLPLPKITVVPTSATICFGKSISLTASGVTNYIWNPILGLNNSTAGTVIASPAISTTYIVKGIDNNGCFDIGQSVIIVDTLPQVSVYSSSFYICIGQPDTLLASGQPSYQWSPSIGLNSTTGDSVIASPTISTLYQVNVTGHNGCRDSAQVEVYVEPKPDVIISPSSPSVCPGDSITLALSGGRTYQWNPTIGLDSIATDTVIASPSNSTTYTIIATGRFGCLDTVQTVVTVGLPKVIISPATPAFCFGQSISLSATGANTYQWSPSTGLNDTIGDSIIANPTITTTYTIIGKNGCSDTVTTVVTVDSIPYVTIPGGSFSICLGQSTPLQAAGANTYQWSPSNSLNTTTGDTVTATPTVATTYTVIGTDGNGCSSSATATIGITLPPNVPSITINHDTLTSSATSHLQWYRNDSAINGATTATYIAKINGWYEVLVVNPANGCSSASDSVYVNLTGIGQLNLLNYVRVFPNPFSSEVFINISSSIDNVEDWSLDITDVLGRTIYAKTSLNHDNIIDLTKMPTGMYFVTINTKTSKAIFPIVRQE